MAESSGPLADLAPVHTPSEAEPHRSAQAGETAVQHESSGRHEWSIGPVIDALNRAQFGVIIKRPGARPTFVNAYAHELLERRNGLTVSDKGLEAVSAGDTKALREAIALAARRQLRACTTLLLPRNGPFRPLAVHVPVPTYDGLGIGLATVFVCDPSREQTVDQLLLSRMFGFTRAEATLAALLMVGKTVEQAADELCVSVHTVRTHLKRMLLKTDTGRQAELLRMLLTCAGQLRLS